VVAQRVGIGRLTDAELKVQMDSMLFGMAAATVAVVARCALVSGDQWAHLGGHDLHGPRAVRQSPLARRLQGICPPRVWMQRIARSLLALPGARASHLVCTHDLPVLPPLAAAPSMVVRCDLCNQGGPRARGPCSGMMLPRAGSCAGERPFTESG